MRDEDFDPSAPGNLVPLSGGALAFMPNRLPPVLAASWQLTREIDDARAAVIHLTGRAKLIPNLELVIRALARREALLSSAIEGTQTQMMELLLQEAHAEIPPAEDSDLFEVVNYVATISLAQEWHGDERPLSLSLIKDLHARLLLGARGENKRPGALRKSDVYIGQRPSGFEGARFVPPPADHVPALMDDLVQYMGGQSQYGPLVDAAIAHYQFETIHPFEDGNGRLGRLLIPAHFLYHGIMERPLLYLAPYFEEHDQAYRDGLLALSQSGDWPAWIGFFLEGIRATAVDALARVNRVMELHEDYSARIAASESRKGAHAALDAVFARVVVSVQLIRDAANVSEPTAGKIVRDFGRLGILSPLRKTGARQLWVATELVDSVYEDGR